MYVAQLKGSPCLAPLTRNEKYTLSASTNINRKIALFKHYFSLFCFNHTLAVDRTGFTKKGIHKTKFEKYNDDAYAYYGDRKNWSELGT